MRVAKELLPNGKVNIGMADAFKNQDLDHRKKEVLEELLYDEYMKTREIAKELDTTDSAVRDWMSRHQLNRPINNKEFVKQKMESDMTAKEIAEEINEHWTDVYAKIEHYGLNDGN